MMLYRVFPYLAGAAADEPGGAFFRPHGGKNRADATDGSYRCLYVGDTPEGSIAEAFGRFDSWDKALLEADPATPLLPRSRFALATYGMHEDEKIRDLDDARVLVAEGLRPSDVVTRNRLITQAWAMRIYAGGHYAGVSWWSYYDASWHSLAVWNISRLQLIGEPELLRLRGTAVERAAGTIARRLIR